MTTTATLVLLMAIGSILLAIYTDKIVYYALAIVLVAGLYYEEKKEEVIEPKPVATIPPIQTYFSKPPARETNSVQKQTRTNSIKTYSM